MKNRIDIISLGCSKNFVDSETLSRTFLMRGYNCELDPEEVKGHTVIINTCGFIGDAKQESIDTILQFARAKDENKIKHLYVMGCLSERYRAELAREIPQVDRFYGKFDWAGLLDDIARANGTPHTRSNAIRRRKPLNSRSCYIKISEGCDRKCAYCVIPQITGRHKSRTMESIIAEVQERVAEGIVEFQLIAQELTYYGLDLYGMRCIAELVTRMSNIVGVKWIRLHYAYPDQFPTELLDVMSSQTNVCKYLDVALQHSSTAVLERMHRNMTGEQTRDFITMLRTRVPGITLRTTLMVGFPGETEEEFEELLDFVRWARFERMGAFMYSEEEGTYSAENYVDDVPPEVKQSRLDRLMKVQQEISAELLAQQIGTVQRVLIDRREGDWYVARTEGSSPEVDPEVLIKADGRRLRKGMFYNATITGSEEFDLYATINEE